MLRVTIVAILVGSVTNCFLGCSKSTSTVSNKSDEAEKSSTESVKNDMNSVKSVPPEGKGLTSPAKQDKGARFDPGMDPSSVTSEYLKSLQKALGEVEHLKIANELLTAEARKSLNLANVDLKLPGTENAKYVVHQAKYVTNEKNIAHVMTSWKDNIDSQPYEYEVTWVLKNEANVGWRVAGMITTGEEENDLVFNFEDPEDIVSKEGADTAENPETRTADKKAETDIR